MKESRVLAIDYGERRIGLAISDPLKIIASMLPALLNEKDIIHRILAIVADRQVDTIVIGDPIREDGKPAKLSAEVHKFGARLEQMTGSKIVYVDERYSSVIALHRLHLAKEKKSRLRSKEKLDSGSACILLEDYLRSLK